MTDITQPRTTAECYADELDRMRGDYGPRDPQEYPHEAYAVDALEAGAAALRVLAQPPVQEGWQTMETAPKDGTRLILLYPQDNAVGVAEMGFWRFGVKVGREVKAGWRYLRSHSSAFDFDHQPTLWMPLPALPTQDKETSR